MAEPDTPTVNAQEATDQQRLQELKTEHSARIKRVHALSGDAKVQAFMDFLAILPDSKPSVTLLAGMVADMAPDEVKKVRGRLTGNAEELDDSHPELRAENEELKKENRAGSETVKNARNLAFWLVSAIILWLPEKRFGPDKFFPGGRHVLKGIIAALGGSIAFVVTNIAATVITTGSNLGANDFGFKARKDSIRGRGYALSQKSREIFIQEELPALLTAALANNGVDAAIPADNYSPNFSERVAPSSTKNTNAGMRIG